MSFLAAYQKLRDSVPRIALVNMNHQNSDFCNYSAENKNSYMIYGSERNDTAMYGTWIYESNHCVDSDFCYKCELCYQCFDCEGCYNCNYCQDCENSTDVEYCYDCVGCNDCFGSVGLRHQRYCVFNEPCASAEEYEQRVRSYREEGAAFIWEQFGKLKQSIPRKFAHQKQSEESTGDYIYTSRRALYSYDIRDIQDSLYMNNSIGATDCIDCSNIYFGCELNYEVMSAINIKNCSYCTAVYDCSDLMYCEQLWNCSDCFLSCTLKRKQYHILNEPYSKKEYFRKKQEIISEMKRTGEWGHHLSSTYQDPLVYGL